MEVIYKCRYCRKEYAEANDALKCEGRHIPIETIEYAEWYKNGFTLYAHTIRVKYLDGHVKEYIDGRDD